MSFIKKLIPLTSLLLATSCQDQNSIDSSTKIVGGSAPAPQSYYAGLVNKGNMNGIMCGTAFISKRVLLTAAHCVDSVSGPLQVRVGMGNDAVADKVLNVEAVIFHEGWDPVNLVNDIAILKVEDYNSDTFGVEITPIAVNQDINLINDNYDKPLRIIGAGKLTSLGDLIDPVLKQVEFPRMANAQCKAEFTNRRIGSTIDERNICGGSSQIGGMSACNGDSGGPLTVDQGGKRLLVGLTSWGLRNCAQTGAPQVYTNVSQFKSWITSKKQLLETNLTVENAAVNLKDLQQAGCYSHLFKADRQIGDPNAFARLTEVFTATNFVRKNTPVTESILESSGSCTFQVPGLGQFTTQLVSQGTTKKLIARNNNLVYESAINTTVTRSLLNCVNASNVRMISLVDNAKGLALIGEQEFRLGATGAPRNILTDDMAVEKCSVGDMSMLTYQVDAQGQTINLMTFHGPNYGKNQDIIFIMTPTNPAPVAAGAAEAAAPVEATPTFVATISNGTMTIKNNTDIELFTWELQCLQSITLTDAMGLKSIPKREIAMDAQGIELPIFLNRFEFGQSMHGSISPNQSVSFKLTTSSPLNELQCQINQIPVKIVVQ